MNLNNVDNELNSKIVEVFKIILKKQEVNILFEQNNLPQYDEMTHVSDNDHFFSLYSHKEEILVNELNYIFYKILPKKIKNKYTDLTNSELITYVISNKYYKLLIPLFGKIIFKKILIIQHYKINYNNVVIELDKLNYDKLMFYTKNVYKLQQLYKLNKELNIEQNFTIVFEDEKNKNELYSTFYINFKDIIKPPESN